MKVLRYEGAYTMSYLDVPCPEPKEHEVRIKIKAVSICGSDLSGYRGINSLRVAPLIMGHEFAGVIDACGTGVTELRPGMRVTVNPSMYCGVCENCKSGNYNLCDRKTVPGTSVGGVNVDGAMAQYLCVRESSVIPLTDGISMEEASVLEPLAVSLHGVKRAGELNGKRVVVIGAGPIGPLAMQCIRDRGAASLIAMDLVDARLHTARLCGATQTLNLREQALDEVWAMTDGCGADVVYDCVGNEKSVEQATQIVRNNGKIVVIGMAAAQITFPIKRFVAHEFQMLGSYQYLDEMKEGMRLVTERKIDLAPIITSVLPLSSGAEAFASLCSASPKDVKIVLVPEEKSS